MIRSENDEKKHMHKGIFTNESQFNNCLLESSQLENPSG